MMAQPIQRYCPQAVGGSILVIDDCALYREALASALVANGMRVVRTAWDLPSLIDILGAGSPLVILLNMAANGAQVLLRASASLSPRVPVVAVGTSGDDEDALVACAECGVAAYHMRADSMADLLLLINVVLEGGISRPPHVPAVPLRRVSSVREGRRPGVKCAGLTSREIQIIDLLQQGRSNHDIAVELSITVHTVKTHVHSLLMKLGVGNRSEAAALALAMDIDQELHEA